jgi:CPA1 family monovalent cation:H+ antiporter
MYDATALTVLVLVGLTVIGLSAVARWTGASGPILLTAGGVVLSFLPATSDVRLPPELVILLFLPALLYWEALNTSVREIRSDFRTLVLSSVFLVVATASSVAVAAHIVIGLSWPVAFVLGAVVAPTDATVVAAVARRLPHRQLTMLRAESLVNDGTALVIFGAAVSVATGKEQFHPVGILGGVGLSYGGGVIIGVALAQVAIRARRLAQDPLIENGISVFTPFVAFLLAEQIHASGVLAVVVCGLVMSRLGPRTIGARTRVQAHAFWQVATFLLNGALFVLVGLQLRSAVRGLTSWSVGLALLAALLIAAVAIGTRLVWMNTVPYLIRLLDRRPAQRLRRIPARQRLPVAWSGFRGAVSLAVALAIPLTTTGGTAFPDRDLLIVITLGVILVTLVGQGLTLPAVIRHARYARDTQVEDEILRAWHRMVESSLDALPGLAAAGGLPGSVVDRLRAEHEQHLHHLEAAVHEDDPAVRLDEERNLRLALLAIKRRELLRMQADYLVDDRVVLRVQAELDADELRITGAPAPE